MTTADHPSTFTAPEYGPYAPPLEPINTLADQELEGYILMGCAVVERHPIDFTSSELQPLDQPGSGT